MAGKWWARGRREGGAGAPKVPSVRWAAMAGAAAAATWALGAAAAASPGDPWWALALGWASSAAGSTVGAWLVGFHELFHAIAAWLTGGSVESIAVSGRDGGSMVARGGFYPAVSCAGYVGSGIFGAMCARHCGHPWARGVFCALCAALALALIAKGSWAEGGALGLAQALAVDALAAWLAWGRRGPFVLAYCGALFLSMGFDDARVLMGSRSGETDAGLLADWLGMPFLTWPIALAYVAAMAAMWAWALLGLARDARAP